MNLASAKVLVVEDDPSRRENHPRPRFQGSARKKIVIVEYDQIVANTYSNKLSVEGYQVETAADGEAGLEVISRFRPDAVILDLMLPKLSGVELLKQVRAVPHFAKLPIVVFSNTYLTHMVQEAWKAGATKCLSKWACSPQQLLETVRRALETNGALPNGAPSALAASAERNAANSHVPAPRTCSSTASKAEAEFEADRRK